MNVKTIASAAFAATMLASVIAHADVEFKPLEQDPEKLVFGFISTESSSNLKAQWQPMIDDMEDALGMEIEAFFAPDYAGIIEGMRFGKVHVGWFGNKSAMEAVDRAGGEVFVQTSKSDGSNGYYSHIITQADNSKLNSLEDLLKCDGSLNFGIGDPNSTSGFLVPSYYVFAQNGVDPKECFKTVRNANHETNLMATANAQVDAAANNSEQLARTNMNKPEVTDKVKVIWTSPLIPSDPMVYRKDLSRELKSEIKAFFLGYGRMGDTVAAEKVLAGIQDGMGKFMESSNAQLYPIRQLALFKDKLKIQNTEELSAEEKAARVAEIDKKLAELDILVAYQ
jgi:phosphonate transport system substrate-binding protein